MAATGRRPDLAVIDALFAAPHRFSFEQAVRLLEAAARSRGGDGGNVGGDSRPADEAVRLHSTVSLRFPASEVTALSRDEAGGPPELTTAVMGLVGPLGVLPQHYTEQLIRALRDRNTALRDFYDLFQHRGLSLFYRAMRKYDLPAAFEGDAGKGEDGVSVALRALVGLATPHLRDRQGVEDETLLYFAGHYAHQPRSASGLQALLSEYFDRPVTVEQFQGHWMVIAEDERSRLAPRDGDASCYGALGDTAVIGERVWDVQSGFRIQLGPLTYAQFEDFMPGGDALRRLVALTRFYVGPDLAFDIQLTLARRDVPATSLGQAKLGWNTWMRGEYETQDRDDAVFAVEGVC